MSNNVNNVNDIKLYNQVKNMANNKFKSPSGI